MHEDERLSALFAQLLDLLVAQDALEADLEVQEAILAQQWVRNHVLASNFNHICKSHNVESKPKADDKDTGPAELDRRVNTDYHHGRCNELCI